MNAHQIVDRLLETGPEPLPTEPLDPKLDADRYHDAQRRSEKTYLDFRGQRQPVEKLPRKPKRAAGRNSVTMSRNRNLRARSFGAPPSKSNYSVRDRGWPT